MEHRGFEDFVQQLKAELTNLPGEAAQYLMSGNYRMPPEETKHYHANARLGAVLILFFPVNDDIFVPLIQRPVYEGVHSGQVAFPGGKKEDSDQDLLETALRETKEEIGVDPSIVEVLGPLTQLYIPPSNFLVTPVVGVSRYKPSMTPDEREVHDILEVDIELLKDDTIAGVKTIKARPGIEFESPYYDVYGRTVWGATAMMISELREILKRIHRD